MGNFKVPNHPSWVPNQSGVPNHPFLVKLISIVWIIIKNFWLLLQYFGNNVRNQKYFKFKWVRFPTTSLHFPFFNQSTWTDLFTSLINQHENFTYLIKQHEVVTSLIKLQHEVFNTLIKQHEDFTSLIKQHEVFNSLIKQHEVFNSLITFLSSCHCPKTCMRKIHSKPS